MLSFSRPEPSLPKMASGYWTQKWCTALHCKWVWGAQAPVVGMTQICTASWVSRSYPGMGASFAPGFGAQFSCFLDVFIVSSVVSITRVRKIKVLYRWAARLAGSIFTIGYIGDKPGRGLWHKDTQTWIVLEFGYRSVEPLGQKLPLQSFWCPSAQALLEATFLCSLQ